MKRFGKSAFVCAGLILGFLGLSNVAHADPITGLFNTGVNALGVPLASPSGQLDTHYVISAATHINDAPEKTFATVAPAYPGNAYAPPLPGSEWITPDAPGNSGVDGTAPGAWDFTTTFSLAGASGAQIVGFWSSDNLNVKIILNGHTVYTSTQSAPTNSFQNPPELFSISSQFLNGLNTLTFEVTNYQQRINNPTALDVAMSGTFTTGGNALPTPEPSSFALLGLGAIGLALSAYRRRAAAV